MTSWSSHIRLYILKPNTEERFRHAVKNNGKRIVIMDGVEWRVSLQQISQIPESQLTTKARYGKMVIYHHSLSAQFLMKTSGVLMNKSVCSTVKPRSSQNQLTCNLVSFIGLKSYSGIAHVNFILYTTAFRIIKDKKLTWCRPEFFNFATISLKHPSISSKHTSLSTLNCVYDSFIAPCNFAKCVSYVRLI